MEFKRRNKKLSFLKVLKEASAKRKWKGNDRNKKQGNFQKCINLKRVDNDIFFFSHYIKYILSIKISCVNGLLYFP